MAGPLPRPAFMVAFVGVCAVHLTTAVLPGRAARLVNRITKPLLMPSLALVARPAPPVIFALAASTVGDAALMRSGNAGLVSGMAGFGAAHLAYLQALGRAGRTASPWVTAGLAVAAGAVVIGVGRTLGRVLRGTTQASLVPATVAYAGLCAGTGAAAIRAATVVGGRRGGLLASGGGLFVVSDLLVAAWMFGPADWRRAGLDMAVMSTYLAAQTCLVAGLAGAEPDDAGRTVS